MTTILDYYGFWAVPLAIGWVMGMAGLIVLALIAKELMDIEADLRAMVKPTSPPAPLQQAGEGSIGKGKQTGKPVNIDGLWFSPWEER
jgi:hypothetical protein